MNDKAGRIHPPECFIAFPSARWNLCSRGPGSRGVLEFLRGRLPLEIVYRKEIGSRSEASKEELRIKRMGVKRKVELVNGGEPVPGLMAGATFPTPWTCDPLFVELAMGKPTNALRVSEYLTSRRQVRKS
jgi:hypothetical protein